MTTQTQKVECSQCNEMFEVSNAIADAMHEWRAASGEPFLCVNCATQIEWGTAIVATDSAEIFEEIVKKKEQK